MSSAAISSLEDLDVANRNLLCSIKDSLKLKNKVRGNIDSMVDPCCNDLRDLKSRYYHKIVEITENADKCFEKECMHTPLGVILSVLLTAVIEYSGIKEIFVTAHSILCILVTDHVHEKKN
ncbi:hypothetical protein GIB67_006883 [Kingdonia uniflora]|uniref:Uncharacterized protein n=1 Tax=Kingdonia uniflora TaxID=39325 RepID=A0A7J7L046_9MAGN|nr:hypothetical protein GIB67_006883 [Kingdonia uniflora]